MNIPAVEADEAAEAEPTLTEWYGAQPTREQWLTEMIGRLFDHARKASQFGSDWQPPRVRVSCGWGGMAPHGRVDCVHGICYAAEGSADATCEIFISPMLSDPLEVVGVLAHELCHAIAGQAAGHLELYVDYGLTLGLTGNPEQMKPGEKLTAIIEEWLDESPAYPHARLDPPAPDEPPEPPAPPPEPAPKQPTRLLKATCPSCGYVIRVTMKWASRGLPRCSSCAGVLFTLADDAAPVTS